MSDQEERTKRLYKFMNIPEENFGFRKRTTSRDRTPINERASTKNGNTIISLVIPSNVLKQIDAYADIMQYLNRSEIIRHAIREFMTRELLSLPKRTFLEEYYDSILVKPK